MLPDNLSGSHKRYKSDTNTFVTWLTRTAIACGYQNEYNASISTASSSAEQRHDTRSLRLKGKKRKEAKAAGAASIQTSPTSTGAIHTISTKELIAQAQYVASHKRPPVTVPLGIQYVLLHAIEERTRCTKWFQNARVEDESCKAELTRANEAHGHFNQVLTQVRELLEPRFEDTQNITWGKKDKIPGATPTITSQKDPSEGLSNRFGLLTMDDLDESTLIAMANDAVDATVTKASTGKGLPKIHDTYELSTDSGDNAKLSVFYFFEDLNQIQGFLAGVWQDVASGDLSSMAAALTTNLALELVQVAEKELLSSMADLPGRQKGTYLKLISLITSMPSQDDDSLDIETMRISKPAAEFTNVSTFLSLRNHRANFSFSESDIAGVKPLAILFADKPALLTLANPDWESEDRILNLLLLELQIWRPNRNRHAFINQTHKNGNLRHGSYCNHFQDAATIALESVTDTRPFDSHIIFSADTLIRIQEILRNKVDHTYKELLFRGAVAAEAVGVTWFRDSTNPAYFRRTEPRNDLRTVSLTTQAINISWNVRANIRDNIFLQSKDVYQDNTKEEAPHEAPEAISPDSDPSFFYKHNPIPSGLEALKLAISVENLGIDLANDMISITLIAHLYNALQQTGRIEGRWAALDKAIQVNISNLFKGDLPSSGEKAASRFFACLGVQAKAFSRGNQPNLERVLRNCNKILETQQLSSHIGEYLSGETNAQKLLFATERFRNRRHRASKQLLCNTSLELLRQCHAEFAAVIPAIDIDYIHLARQCDELLLRIRQRLDFQVGIEHLLKEQELAEISKHSNMACVLDILGNLLEDRNESKSGKKGDIDYFYSDVTTR